MAYLGKTPSQAVRSRYYYTATGGETSLSGADDNSNVLTFTDGNYVDVYLNGVLLVAGVFTGLGGSNDYYINTTNTITLNNGLTASDVVEVIVYDTFSVFGGNMAANLNFKDNVKANFGDGSDLQIYHDGSHSRIAEVGNGRLTIETNGDSIRLTKGATENMLIATPDGSVDLYYDNAVKLATTSTGVDVTGNIVATGTTGGVAKLRLAAEEVHGEIEGINIGNNFGGLAFKTNSNGTTAERMRLDSDGNLLVGTTDTTPYNNNAGTSADQGFVVTDGRIFAATNGNSVSILNRTDSDGDIVQFRKDGTTVGSIAVSSSDNFQILGAATDHAGFEFGTTTVIPKTNGATADGVIDLGFSSGRFNNLYLSGGVYLGGTGSANLLNDYEEGTWTPIIGGSSGESGQSYAIQEGGYTKIGNLVYASGYVVLSAKGTITGTYAYIKNLPFTSTSSYFGSGSVPYFANLATTVWNSVGLYPNKGANYMYIVGTTTAQVSTSYMAPSDIANTTGFLFHVTYAV